MKELKNLYSYLKKSDKKILFLTTSNRWSGQNELPKSTIIANELASQLKSVEIINVSKLKIFPCEGNVSRKDGNSCGIKKALLDDNKKNPSGHHRCWANINSPEDELWKISRELLESDAVVFFGIIK